MIRAAAEPSILVGVGGKLAIEENQMSAPTPVGVTTITEQGRVNLPLEALRQLRWKLGDRLLVEVLDEELLLIRRPATWVDAFTGRLGEVFGTHEETLRWLEEERAGWDQP